MSLGRSSRWAIACMLACTLLTPLAGADLGPDQGPSVEVTESAREQFRVGVALLQDPDGARYEEAFKAFSRAYAESPSWKILGNLGLCALKLERFTEGIVAYERYLKYGGEELTAAERTQTERDLRVMKATSAKVTLIVSGAERTFVRDTRTRSVGGPITNTYEVPESGTIELLLASGDHTLVASAGDKTAEIKLKVESGVNIDKTLTLEETSQDEPAPVVENPPSQEPTPLPIVEGDPKEGRGLRTAGFVVAGTGVAALIGGGVTTILGFGLKGKLDDACPGGVCEPTSSDEEDDFESDKRMLSNYGTLSTALYIGGGVLTAAGVTMIVLGSKKKGDERVSLRLNPVALPGFAGISAKGAF